MEIEAVSESNTNNNIKHPTLFKEDLRTFDWDRVIRECQQKRKAIAPQWSLFSEVQKLSYLMFIPFQ